MALTEDNILGSFLPTVHISRVIINENKIDLTLMIIDSTVGEEATSFLNNENFYLESVVIKIIQSKNINLTNDLLSGVPIAESQYKNFAEPFSMTPLAENAELVTYNDPELFRIIPLRQINRIENGNNGEKIYYYDISYDISPNPHHISYIVYSEIDTVSELFDGLTFSQSEISQIPKKITVDTIIDESKVKAVAYNYLLDNGSVWLGEVLYDRDQDRYETLEEQPRTLNLVQVPNYKIQDFRGRNLINRNNVDVNIYQASSKLLELSELSSNSSLPTRNTPVFNYINKIVNSDKTISLILSINAKELILQNCLYPRVISQSTINAQSSNLLNSLTLWRRKIKSTIENEIVPEENEIPVIIENNFTDKRINLNLNDNVFFLLKDQAISSINEGKYQYGISVSFYDPSIKILKDKLILLNIARKYLLEYYNFCELNLDYSTNYFKPEVRLRYLEPDQINEQNQTSYLGTVVNIYLSSIDFILEKNESQISIFENNQTQTTTRTLNINEMRNLLNSSISPTNGTLDGIFLFLKMFDDAISDISKILTTANVATEALNNTDDALNVNITKPMIDKTFYFKETIHNASDNNKIELGYIDVRNGFVSYGNFLQLLDQTYTDNDFLFLSPLYIDINNNKLFLEQFEDSSEEAKIQKFLLLKNKILEINFDKSLYANTEDFSITELDSGNNPNFIKQLKIKNNELMKNNLFAQNSVIFEEKPETFNLTYDQYLDVNKVINPKDEIKISNSVEVKQLRDLILDLNNEEQFFKYRLLNSIEYFSKVQNLYVWQKLNLRKISDLQSSGYQYLLCRLTKYDYLSLETSSQIKNVNNFNYNDTFIIDLNNFLTEDLFQAEQFTGPRNEGVNLSADIDRIRFNNIAIGNESYVDFNIRLIYNELPNDIRCEIIRPSEIINQIAYDSLRIELNLFKLNFEFPQKIRVYFSPTIESNFETKIRITSLTQRQYIEIPILASSVKPITVQTQILLDSVQDNLENILQDSITQRTSTTTIRDGFFIPNDRGPINFFSGQNNINETVNQVNESLSNIAITQQVNPIQSATRLSDNNQLLTVTQTNVGNVQTANVNTQTTAAVANATNRNLRFR